MTAATAAANLIDFCRPSIVLSTHGYRDTFFVFILEEVIHRTEILVERRGYLLAGRPTLKTGYRS